ncbi:MULTISPECIES: hypothetical protein [Halomonadaceae]|uniref:Uncharacterized protein n=1 Tax=Halomonas campaniensis TaxID=213554 RepID=A0A246RUF1_9GAMM|nr:hypothetical protein [Halomonas campaniensis]MBS3668765.1 hypothetical protein [Halomonas boliviensis]OWV27581.1 hypothetical protein JI62_20710 [Halomonas campaniensis]
MSEQDQAAGLRKWANLQRQQQQAEGAVDVAAAEPVPEPEQASPFLTPKTTAVEAPTMLAPPKPKIPLVVVGLPGSGAVHVNKVKARLGQWSALGRNWAGNPDDWDIRIVMAETSDLAQLREQYSRWALWISSDADTFAVMFRTLRQLHERGGPRRLLALHEPHLPRQGLLNNLREAADYYLNMELLVLAR